MTKGRLLRPLAIQTMCLWRIFWRTRVLMFFTFIAPLMIFVLINLLFTGKYRLPFASQTASEFYGPAIAAYGVVSATFGYLATTVAYAREFGALKRIRGTPTPPMVHIGARLSTAIIIALIDTAAILGLAVAAYGLNMHVVALPSVAVSLVVGGIVFGVLGIALANFCPTGNSAPALVNAIVTPLAFVSNLFIPLSHPSAVVSIVGDAFPLKPFVLSFESAVRTRSLFGGLSLSHLAVLAGWGAVGTLVAYRWFRWAPAIEDARRGTADLRTVAA